MKHKGTIVFFFALLTGAIACLPARGGDTVDCNYHWPRKGVHVCIEDMPRGECDLLFRARPEFSRDDACVCDESGRVKRKVRGRGYTQFSCR